MEWELSNPQVFWTDNAAHYNLVWWRWDFFSPLARKRQIKWRKRKRKRGASSKYIFEQQWPVVYLMIALLLLNLTSLSSLSVPINTFPLRHSWNSSHINSQKPPPHLSLSVTAPRVIIAWSLSASASQTYEQVNMCSDMKVMLITMHF